MKRNSFLKSLVTLFAAPSLVKDIDWGKKKETANLGIWHRIKNASPTIEYKAGSFSAEDFAKAMNECQSNYFNSMIK